MESKDADFAALARAVGDGPQIVWLTCGNTSNARLKTILEATMPKILARLSEGARVVRIHDDRSLA